MRSRVKVVAAIAVVASTLFIAGLGTGWAILLRHGDVVGLALMQVGLRTAQAGGASPAVTQEEIRAVVDELVTEKAIALLPVGRPSAKSGR